MRHESQAQLVILLSTGCYETKTNNNKALLEKKKSSISELPTPSLLPTPHSSAIQEEPQRFFLLFIIPSIRAGNYHTGWRAVLTTQHGTRDCLGRSLCSSHSSQQKFPSKDVADKSSAVPCSSPTNLCQE